MLLIANWKAYIGDLKKAKELLTLSKRLVRGRKIKIVIAPPAAFLGILASGNSSTVLFAAQDVSATTGGAQTGEIVAQMYASAGAEYAIVGHSERRAAGDTDAIVAQKLAHALAHGLIPILCIGEQVRDSEGKYLAVVREQLTRTLTPLTLKERKQVIIAYEPVWAINKSSAFAINTNDLTEMVLYIRKVLGELLLGKSSTHNLVLYGGSVEPEGVRALSTGTGINGFIIGHASADPHIFAQLVKEVS
jgi:triosephosphate isomerase (TIM)